MPIEYRDGVTEDDVRDFSHEVKEKLFDLLKTPKEPIPWRDPFESGPLREVLEKVLEARNLPDFSTVETACDDTKWAPPKSEEEMADDIERMMQVFKARIRQPTMCSACGRPLPCGCAFRGSA